MVIKIMKLKLEEMQDIAQRATLEALKKYERPEGRLEDLTLGAVMNETEGLFELYIAGDAPQDAKMISCAKVQRSTGQVSVEVFLKRKSN